MEETPRWHIGASLWTRAPICETPACDKTSSTLCEFARDIEDAMMRLMSANIVQSLGTMLDTVVF